jgi:Flp pilus assembly pilin Flp
MRFPLHLVRADRSAATAIEYALVALLISIAAFSAISTVGTSVTHAFSTVATSF